MLASLKSIGCAEGMAAPDSLLCGLFQQSFDDDDPRLLELRRVLSERNVRVVERIETSYTDKELRSFPYLHLMVDRTEISPFGPSHGTTYDLSTGCPQCGCGARQTSPFYGPIKSFPKSGMIVRSSTEMFVADALANALRRAEVTGLELRRARSSRGHEPLSWHQIIAHVTLPKMSPATKGIIRGDPPPCPVCRRDGHYHTIHEPEEIVYRREEVNVDALPDIVATWECFGKSYIGDPELGESRFAGPLILTKPSVLDVFRETRVKHARFVPVRVE